MAEESKKPKKEYMPPSEDFITAVTGGGSIVTDCDLCGRTCFEDSEYAGDWEEGELERLRENADKQPDKYVALIQC